MLCRLYRIVRDSLAFNGKTLNHAGQFLLVSWPLHTLLRMLFNCMILSQILDSPCDQIKVASSLQSSVSSCFLKQLLLVPKH